MRIGSTVVKHGTLPTVDVELSTAATDLSAALEQLGFVQLVNHGLDRDVSANLRSACDTFFARAEADKRQFVHSDPAANRGYRAKGSEALSYSLGEASPPDLFESFNCGSDDRVSTSVLQQPTPWPSERFADAAGAYLVAMEAISGRLDALIGPILGIDDLAHRSTSGPDTMACINYTPNPDGTEPASVGQQRMGAHSDYTSFTILLADSVPGLQIVGSNGGWIDVIPEPEALLMNVGDVLAMFTNDHWPSTLHRVVPMAGGAAPERRSVAYFHYPNLDVVVAPLAQFTSSNRPARYKPVTVETHLLGKLTAPKLHRPASSASTVAGRATS